MGLKILPQKSGEFLLEIIMRRYENRSTMMTSNRPIEEWGKLLSDVPEHAQQMAGHESPRTTKLYDRTKDEITLSEVEQIRLCCLILTCVGAATVIDREAPVRF
jgi:IstB-like ATP binding protein